MTAQWLQNLIFTVLLGVIELPQESVENIDGDEDIIYLSGINQNHTGVELEFSAQINDMFRLDLGAGLGNWLYTEDATGTYRDSDGESSYPYALKDLKVGDMLQQTLHLV